MNHTTEQAQKAHAWYARPGIFLKWVLFACITGLVAGGAAAFFSFCFLTVTRLRTGHPWLIFLLPAGGVVIALLYRACGLEKDRGTNRVFSAVREKEPLPLRTAPLVFFSTILTHLLGGSSGREGAILQIGASLSSYVGRRMRLDGWNIQVMAMCGMAAAFSALFGTPLTAALFAIEVVNVGMLYYAALVPCVLSALISFLVAKAFGVLPTAFVLTGIPDLTPVSLIQAVIMGILCALLAILFCRVMHGTAELYERYLPRPVLRAAVGGVLVLALTFLVWLWAPGTYDYNGAGSQVIHAALAGSARPEAFLLKLLFTALTLGAGFKGGEIVPVFFTGATFGCVVSPLLGLNPSFGAGLGMVSLFCGVTNCPMSSMLLALELFAAGSSGLLTTQSLGLLGACLAVSYLLSANYGLYSGQKILYSKFTNQFINRNANEKEDS